MIDAITPEIRNWCYRWVASSFFSRSSHWFYLLFISLGSVWSHGLIWRNLYVLRVFSLLTLCRHKTSGAVYTSEWRNTLSRCPTVEPVPVASVLCVPNKDIRPVAERCCNGYAQSRGYEACLAGVAVASSDPLFGGTGYSYPLPWRRLSYWARGPTTPRPCTVPISKMTSMTRCPRLPPRMWGKLKHSPLFSATPYLVRWLQWVQWILGITTWVT